MVEEEVQYSPGGDSGPPVKIESEPEKPKTRKKSSGGAKKKTAVKGGAKKKSGTGKKTAARKGTTKGSAKKTTATAKARKATTGTRRKAKTAPATLAVAEDARLKAGHAEQPAYIPAVAPPVVILHGARVEEPVRTRQVVIDPPPTAVTQAVPGIVKVRNIDATLTGITAQVITNKVIVQGQVHLQIFFVQIDGMVHHLAEDVPFHAMLDIPGATPEMKAIVQPRIAAVLFHLSPDGRTLKKKVIVDVFAKVVEEVQIRPVPGVGPTLLLQEVVGEGTAQKLSETLVQLALPAIKVDEIRGEILDVTAEVIPGKVIVQGRIHKQIFFVGEDNIGHHQAEDVQFSVFVDIPGATPGMNVQVQPRIETIIFHLTPPTALRQKVVVEVFVKVTTPTQFQAALGAGPLVRVAAVAGEGQDQILRRDVVTLDRPASKVREITAVLTDLRSHVIPGKAILQGTVHKQIFYIGLDGIEYHQAEDVPFHMMAEVPGATTGLDLVAEPVIESVLFNLLGPTELEEKVIINARMIAVEQRQVMLVLGEGPLVKVEQVIGENLNQVLVRLVNHFEVSAAVQELMVSVTSGTMEAFRKQAIVENEVDFPTMATSISEAKGQIQNLNITILVGGLIVEGDVHKDVKFIDQADMVRTVSETVPFSFFVPSQEIKVEIEESGVESQKTIADLPPEEALRDLAQVKAGTEVRIEQILFALSPDGRTARQVIVLVAAGHAAESRTETFTAVTDIQAPGLTLQKVLVQEPVLVDGTPVTEQFTVITGISGPGMALITDVKFGVHVLHVVGDGIRALKILQHATPA